jgi:hypothetical protein
LGATALLCLWRLDLGVAAASDSPVDLIADEAGYDQDLGVYVARGHVEMAQDDRVVMADTITYNERAKTISASGNVALLMPNGDTVFANYVDLSDDFKDGVIRSFRALLKDKSRLAAYSAHRVGGTKEILNKAVYTPCLPCRSDPTRQPVWQIKADQVDVGDLRTLKVSEGFADSYVVRYGDAGAESQHWDGTGISRRGAFLSLVEIDQVGQDYLYPAGADPASLAAMSALDDLG